MLHRTVVISHALEKNMCSEFLAGGVFCMWIRFSWRYQLENDHLSDFCACLLIIENST